MEKINICRLKKKEDILEVFSFFTNRFVSLSRGKDYCEALAKKYEENAEFLVLYCEGKLAAFASFYCNDAVNKTAYLSLIAVLERFEGNGFGEMMLDKVISVSREKGMQTISLEVRKSNIGAVSLYHKKGFVTQKQKDERMLIMSKDLL